MDYTNENDETKMRKGARTRQAILYCAARLFETKGFYSTGIEDIAKDLHIAKGTLYQYFPEKSALIRTLITEGLEEVASRFDEAGKTAKNLRELLVELLYRTILFLVNEYDLVTLFFHAGFGVTIEWNGEAKVPMHLITELFSRALEPYRDEFLSSCGQLSPGLLAFFHTETIHQELFFQGDWHNASPEKIRQLSELHAGMLLNGILEKP